MSQALERQRDYWNREIASFDAIYSKEKTAFGRWLDMTFRRDMFQRYEYTLRNAEPITGRDFLDVGCGTGRYAFELLRRGCRHVTGIDISEAMVDHCRNTAATDKVEDRAEFLRSDLIEFLPQRRFHTAISIGLFDYIRDPLPVLIKMRECVDDAVIASFPRMGTWRAPVRKMRLAVRGCYVRFFSRSQVEALLKNAGLGSYSIEKVGKLFCVTARSG
jgi:SAM-dependent methyltransferase